MKRQQLGSPKNRKRIGGNVPVAASGGEVDMSGVLVVEDVRHIARLLRFQLQRAGYEVDVVADGDLVMDAVERTCPSAIILDLVLPGRSGIDICRDLRADARFAKLAIIVVTGHSFEACGEEVDEAGADCHFAKPISPTSLIQKLEELGVKPKPVGTAGPGSAT